MFTVKIIQFWRYPDFLPVLYSNRPIPGERKELRSSFLFTKENIKITEFSAARIGERISDHWAVTGPAYYSLELIMPREKRIKRTFVKILSEPPFKVGRARFTTAPF